MVSSKNSDYISKSMALGTMLLTIRLRMIREVGEEADS